MECVFFGLRTMLWKHLLPKYSIILHEWAIEDVRENGVVVSSRVTTGEMDRKLRNLSMRIHKVFGISALHI